MLANEFMLPAEILVSRKEIMFSGWNVSIMRNYFKMQQMDKIYLENGTKLDAANYADFSKSDQRVIELDIFGK